MHVWGQAVKPALHLVWIGLFLSGCERTDAADPPRSDHPAQSATLPSHVTDLDNDQTRSRAIATALEGDIASTLSLADYYGMTGPDPDNQRERWLRHAIELGDSRSMVSYAVFLRHRAAKGDCDKAGELLDTYAVRHPEDSARTAGWREEFTRYPDCPR